jgi:prepilin-type N-terminal cleavage/methylation domain-containing protein
MRYQNGLTLIEVILSLAIFALTIAPWFTIQIQSQQGLVRASQSENALNWGTTRLQELELKAHEVVALAQEQCSEQPCQLSDADLAPLFPFELTTFAGGETTTEISFGPLNCSESPGVCPDEEAEGLDTLVTLTVIARFSAGGREQVFSRSARLSCPESKCL